MKSTNNVIRHSKTVSDGGVGSTGWFIEPST